MSVEDILKEKTSADHLLYVSMKYTKTCDVMLNLLSRWKVMIETSLDALLEKAKKKKKVKIIPPAPLMKIAILRKIFKKEEIIIETLDLYEFFRKVPSLGTARESEFRKNVNLKITEFGKETRIDLEKLQEYAEILERFIKFVREYLSS